MMRTPRFCVTGIICALFALSLCGCAGQKEENVFFNELVDFASIQTVAVLPFQNLTNDEDASERVRDVFMGMLLATEAVYVVPTGEVRRAINRVGIIDPATPSSEEIKNLAGILEVDVVVTGVLREYQLVRSGASTANIISFSLQMIETETGQVIWNAASTKGGITVTDRLFGGGGEPMNYVTLEGVDDLLDKLFQ